MSLGHVHCGVTHNELVTLARRLGGNVVSKRDKDQLAPQFWIACAGKCFNAQRHYAAIGGHLGLAVDVVGTATALRLLRVPRQ